MKELGKKLREARIARKIDFETIYEHTRIPVSTIQSIEQGEIGDLPKTYYRAFVRTIAKEVGLDGDILLKEFDVRTKQQMDFETEGEHEERFSINEFIAFERLARGIEIGSFKKSAHSQLVLL